VVLDIPPAADGSITGSIDDGWQNTLEDVGPAGVDKGEGGKYVTSHRTIRKRSWAQTSGSNAIPVTVDNFIRAETDLYLGAVVKKDGFGKFEHNREPLPIDKQTVIRTNRDTLYSGAVFDLDAAPVAITLPMQASGSCQCR
jgi:hypothetical protein